MAKRGPTKKKPMSDKEAAVICRGLDSLAEKMEEMLEDLRNKYYLGDVFVDSLIGYGNNRFDWVVNATGHHSEFICQNNEGKINWKEIK